MIFIYLILGLIIAWVIMKIVVYYHMEYIQPVHIIDDQREKVLIIGDSVAFGMFLWNRKNNRYSNLLQKDDKDIQVINLGVNGAVVKTGWPRTYSNHEYFEIIKNNTFDKIILHIGSNDTKDGYWVREEVFRNDYMELFLKVKSLNPNAKIVIMSVTPVYPKLWFKEPFYGIKQEHIQTINKILKDISEDQDVDYINLYDKFENHKGLFADGAHPNVKGHRVIYKTIKEYFKSRS